MSLGENIYRLRQEKNLSQQELAEALAVSRQSISKWETDGATPELDKLMKLAQLFEVSLDELVYGQKEEPTPPKQNQSLNLNQSETEAPKENKVEPKTGLSTQKIIGLVAFWCGFCGLYGFSCLGCWSFSPTFCFTLYHLRCYLFCGKKSCWFVLRLGFVDHVGVLFPFCHRNALDGVVKLAGRNIYYANCDGYFAALVYRDIDRRDCDSV